MVIDGWVIMVTNVYVKFNYDRLRNVYW